MYYFAFGANLDILDFQNRCADAAPVQKWQMPDHKLTFHAYANVEEAAGQTVDGAIYKISQEDEAILDIFEGYNPDDPRHSLYTKTYQAVPKLGTVMYYQMNLAYCPQLEPPKLIYFAGIWQGYVDWRLDTEKLKKALIESQVAFNTSFEEFFNQNDFIVPPGASIN